MNCAWANRGEMSSIKLDTVWLFCHDYPTSISLAWLDSNLVWIDLFQSTQIKQNRPLVRCLFHSTNLWEICAITEVILGHIRSHLEGISSERYYLVPISVTSPTWANRIQPTSDPTIEFYRLGIFFTAILFAIIGPLSTRGETRVLRLGPTGKPKKHNEISTDPIVGRLAWEK